MEWIVSLKGDDFDVLQLLKLSMMPDITTKKKDNRFIVKSSLFQSLNSSEEVKKTTEELLIIVNTASKFVLNSGTPITRDLVIEMDLGIEKTKFSFLQATTDGRAEIRKRKSGQSEPPYH